MCDHPSPNECTGWRGWNAQPALRLEQPLGAWVDLTYPFSPEVPHVAIFSPPKISQDLQMPVNPLNVTRIDTVVHMGTHVDAPRHFFLDGPSMEAVPLERLMGPGVVLRIEKPPYGLIEAGDLERAEPGVRPGDIVAVCLDWGAKWGTADWDRQPSFSPEASRWLCDRGVKLLAIDSPTPDLAVDRRPPDFNWPVHHALLAHGILIAEQLANLPPLAGQRVEFLFSPLPIVRADGSPARVLARPIAGC